MFSYVPNSVLEESLRRAELEEEVQRAEFEESLKLEKHQTPMARHSEGEESSKHKEAKTTEKNRRKTMSTMEAKLPTVRRVSDLEASSDTKSGNSKVFTMSDTDCSMNICNTFWRAQLSFNQYKYGDSIVDFSAIWPDESTLKKLSNEVYQGTILRSAVLDICMLVLRCGPLRMIKVLLELRIIGLDQKFENGSSMLHLACIARNYDAVAYLCQQGLSGKIKDRNGRTAEQVCFCPKIRKLLPRHKLNSYHSPGKNTITKKSPSMMDKESIFKLAKNVRNFDELQIRLQTFDFDVNSERNSKGDHLIHLAARGGLPQVPLLMALVKIQKADIELANVDGMTPLMLVAEAGNTVLVDVLICILGANPNTPNPQTGMCALHYAAGKNHIDTVNCLIKRGADFNIEDDDGRCADDVAHLVGADDCREVIEAQRIQRIECLTDLVERGELFSSHIRHSDLYTVNKAGRTLIMTAAENNRIDNLALLLERECCPMDAQHQKDGKTALALAAIKGHTEAAHVLLSHGARPIIRDIHGLLPLHYAVKSHHIEVVEVMLQFSSALTGLCKCLNLARKSLPDMQIKVREAMDRRQKEIVTPKLFECALSGDAGELYCLLEEGDKVNPSTAGGNWPVMIAVENAVDKPEDGHLDVLKLLYENGGDIGRQHPSMGNTVLHVACVRGHYSIFNYLIQFTKSGPEIGSKSNSRVINVNAVNTDGKTALELAAEKGYSKIVRSLLQNGATTAVVDYHGELVKFSEFPGVQVLIETRRKEHTKLVMKFLSEKKGLQKLKTVWLPRFDHNLRDDQGDTPLMVACKIGKVDQVKFLLESAVYSLHEEQQNDSQHDSDTDSGTASNQLQGSVRIESDISDDNAEEAGIALNVSKNGWSVVHSDGELDAETTPTHVRHSTGMIGSQSVMDLTFSRRGRSKRIASDQTATRPRKLPLGDLKSVKKALWPSFHSKTDSQHIESQVNRFPCNEPDESPIKDPNLPENQHNESNPNEALNIESQSKAPAHSLAYLLEPDPRDAKEREDMTSLVARMNNSIGTIFRQDNSVSHVLAVSSRDGATCLHRTIEGGDWPDIVTCLLTADSGCVNMQDHKGLSAVHLACQLGRKKTLDRLTSLLETDLNLRTLEGKLPEEMTTNKTLKRMVQSARAQQPDLYVHDLEPPSRPESRVSRGSSVDFDKMNMKFQALKAQYKAQSPVKEDV